MKKDGGRTKARWALYQLDVPGPACQRTVVAPSLTRALELALTDEDDLTDNEMLVVWNVTATWICHSPVASQSTWSLLKDKREGLVDYDHQEGWIRQPVG